MIRIRVKHNGDDISGDDHVERSLLSATRTLMRMMMMMVMMTMVMMMMMMVVMILVMMI